MVAVVYAPVGYLCNKCVTAAAKRGAAKAWGERGAASSHLERRALACHFDGAAEGLLGFLAGPVGVELVGDVDEDESLGSGGSGVLAGLRGGQVAALAGALRAG